MDTAQWPQEIVVKPLEEITRRPPQKEQGSLNCPRCKSSNTKFCYYNNYSLTQPRYLCKTCKRYWTQGGSLRNIPLGGPSRKIHKRPSSSSNSNKLPDLVAPKIHEAQDLDPPQAHISSSALELFTEGFSFSSASIHQDPNSVSVYTNGLSFLLDGFGNGANDSNNGIDHNHQQSREQGGDHVSTGGYWTGMLGGGGSW